VFPFHPAGGVAANAFDGPELWRAGIGQVSLDVPVGQGSVNQHVGDASDPFNIFFREHGVFRWLAWYRTRRRSTRASAFSEPWTKEAGSELCLLLLEPEDGGGLIAGLSLGHLNYFGVEF
jgi:hypothetical protein